MINTNSTCVLSCIVDHYRRGRITRLANVVCIDSRPANLEHLSHFSPARLLTTTKLNINATSTPKSWKTLRASAFIPNPTFTTLPSRNLRSGSGNGFLSKFMRNRTARFLEENCNKAVVLYCPFLNAGRHSMSMPTMKSFSCAPSRVASRSSKVIARSTSAGYETTITFGAAFLIGVI